MYFQLCEEFNFHHVQYCCVKYDTHLFLRKCVESHVHLAEGPERIPNTLGTEQKNRNPHPQWLQTSLVSVSHHKEVSC
jgi:hypothetical protein